MTTALGDRLDAVRLLHGSQTGGQQLLEALGRDGDWRVRCAAAKALAGGTGEALGRALGDGNAFVREAAAEALGHGANGVALPLEALLRHDPVAAVRCAAARALGRWAERRRGLGGRALGDALEDSAWQALSGE